MLRRRIMSATAPAVVALALFGLVACVRTSTPGTRRHAGDGALADPDGATKDEALAASEGGAGRDLAPTDAPRADDAAGGDASIDVGIDIAPPDVAARDASSDDNDADNLPDGPPDATSADDQGADDACATWANWSCQSAGQGYRATCLGALTRSISCENEGGNPSCECSVGSGEQHCTGEPAGPVTCQTVLAVWQAGCCVP